MAFDDYGAPQFGLDDLKVATYNDTNDYGSEVDVMAAQAMNTIMRVINAELEGDDVIVATASRPIGAQIEMRFGSVSLAALEVMIGNTATSSVASPNEVKQFKIAGGERLPYFGMAGKALAEEGSGDTTVFVPKCRIMSDFQLIQLEYGTFAIPSVTVMAVPDDTYGLLNIIEHQTSTAIAIPTANIA